MFKVFEVFNNDETKFLLFEYPNCFTCEEETKSLADSCRAILKRKAHIEIVEEGEQNGM